MCLSTTLILSRPWIVWKSWQVFGLSKTKNYSTTRLKSNFEKLKSLIQLTRVRFSRQHMWPLCVPWGSTNFHWMNTPVNSKWAVPITMIPGWPLTMTNLVENLFLYFLHQHTFLNMFIISYPRIRPNCRKHHPWLPGTSCSSKDLWSDTCIRRIWKLFHNRIRDDSYPKCGKVTKLT